MEDKDSESTPPTAQSLYGSWAYLGPAPTDADIDEIRQEVWKPLFGAMKGSVTHYDDLISPIDLDWEADK